MKNFCPSVAGLVGIAILAAIAGAVIAIVGVSEASLLGVAFPLLLASMLLGAHRGGHLSSRHETESKAEPTALSGQRD